jgi:DNA modification methylase
LLTGDAVRVLQTLPTGSADCVVTSPPYWRLRDYGTGSWTGGSPTCPHLNTTDQHGPPLPESTPCSCTGCGARWTDEQYGLETTQHAYIQHLRQVFAQLHRVVVPTGTVWLNLGDSYSTNSDGYRCARPGQYRQPRYRPPADVPHKNLLGMPWRVTHALQDDGWILRNVVIWHKPNTAPFPSRDRLTCRYETLFLLVRQPDHFLDPFSGTGTTGQAAVRLHRPYTGIELNPAFNHQALAHLGGLPFRSAAGRISGPPAGPTSCLSPVPPPQQRGRCGG